jgi:hypothetical protein
MEQVIGMPSDVAVVLVSLNSVGPDTSVSTQVVLFMACMTYFSSSWFNYRCL